jgi:dTMP kinase
MNTTSKGFFIVFDGPDGAGRSTQIQIIAKILQDLDIKVMTTCEPTDGHFGKLARFYNQKDLPIDQRIDPLDHQKIFIEDRKEHTAKVKEWILAGYHVLCDRYWYSTAAYGASDGVPFEELILLNSHFPRPDLALFFETSAEIAMDRILHRQGEIERFENTEFQVQVIKRYNQLKQRCPEVCPVNASGAPESITPQILFYLGNLIPELKILT